MNSFLSALQIVLIVLKLIGVIEISWLCVFIPLLLPLILMGAMLAFGLVLSIFIIVWSIILSLFK